jgi:prevent-host-death family protein
MSGTGDEAIRSGGTAGGTAPGLEGLPRMDMGALQESLPSLVEVAAGGPVVLTRNGADTLVVLPLDAYRRLWAQAPRPPVIDASEDGGGA